MEYPKKLIDMIMEYADAFGPSGFEDDVLLVARKYLDGLGEIKEDHMRNLYLYRKENTGDKPVLMLDAHSDEVGFMVHSVKPNGTLRFVKLGSTADNALSSADVLVRNTRGEYIPGVIAAKPPHFASQAERNQTPSYKEMVIDIGAASYDEAVNDFAIGIGEPVVPATKCRFDEKHGLFFGRAFDCRIGCAVMTEALRRLEGETLGVDVVAVLSSQEELGERGCKLAANRVKPDIAYAFEGCPADDTFTEPYAIQTAMRKGPMFRHMDVSVICTPRYQRFVLDLAKEKNIKAQASVREGGGNDGAVLINVAPGAPVVVAGVPVRYIHSSNCITAYEDFESSVQLTVEVLKALNADVVAGF